MKRILALLVFVGLIVAGCGEKITVEKENQKNSSDNKVVIKQNTEKSLDNFVAADVVRIVDGDTIVARFNGKEEKVRFIGVNTPESTTRHEPYGKEASAYTKKELKNKKIYLEKDVGERDKYGRILAYIWLEKPASFAEKEIRAGMFNARLVAEGYAQVMTVPPNVKYADLFVRLQREAREANKGLWGLKVK